MSKDNIKLVLKNKKAFFNYEVIEKYEAGMVLKGTEVKSIRNGKVSIVEGFVRPSKGELFVYQMDISPYKWGRVDSHQPKRPRKLLMRRAEINRLIGKIKEKGLTLVPLSLYFKNGFAKIELGLARGKKLYDKRESLRKKDTEREIRKALKRDK